MKAIYKAHQVLALGLVILFAQVVFSPQFVEAKVEVRIETGGVEGDPTGGWESDGSSGGGGGYFLPSDEGNSSSALNDGSYSFDGRQVLLGNSYVILFPLIPSFDCHTISATCISFEIIRR